MYSSYSSFDNTLFRTVPFKFWRRQPWGTGPHPPRLPTIIFQLTSEPHDVHNSRLYLVPCSLSLWKQRQLPSTDRNVVADGIVQCDHTDPSWIRVLQNWIPQCKTVYVSTRHCDGACRDVQWMRFATNYGVIVPCCDDTASIAARLPPAHTVPVNAIKSPPSTRWLGKYVTVSSVSSGSGVSRVVVPPTVTPNNNH